jgi:hypothetical protein
MRARRMRCERMAAIAMPRPKNTRYRIAAIVLLFPAQVLEK